MSSPDRDLGEERVQGEQDPQGLHYTMGPQRNSLERGAETWPNLGRDPGMQACTHEWRPSSFSKQKLRDIEKNWPGGPNTTHLTNRKQSGEFGPNLLWESNRLGSGRQELNAWDLFTLVKQRLSQAGKPNPPTYGITGSAERWGQAQEFSCCTHFSGERRKISFPDTVCYTAPWALI